MATISHFLRLSLPFLFFPLLEDRISKLPVSPGFRECRGRSLVFSSTWTYYTSYIDVWKEEVPTLSIFLSIIENNTRLLLSAPASYFFIKLPAVGATVQGMVVLT